MIGYLAIASIMIAATMDRLMYSMAKRKLKGLIRQKLVANFYAPRWMALFFLSCLVGLGMLASAEMYEQIIGAALLVYGATGIFSECFGAKVFDSKIVVPRRCSYLPPLLVLGRETIPSRDIGSVRLKSSGVFGLSVRIRRTDQARHNVVVSFLSDKRAMAFYQLLRRYPR